MPRFRVGDETLRRHGPVLEAAPEETGRMTHAITLSFTVATSKTLEIPTAKAVKR
jgi:hypothetical protein